MQQKETERADDRIDEEFYEELSEEEIKTKSPPVPATGVHGCRDIMQNRPRDTDSGTGPAPEARRRKRPAGGIKNG